MLVPAYGDAQFLKNLGIIEGIGDNMLAPESTVIRGDFAVMMDKALNLEDSASNAFSDCDINSYFTESVNRVDDFVRWVPEANVNCISIPDVVFVIKVSRIIIPFRDISANFFYDFSKMTVIFNSTY